MFDDAIYFKGGKDPGGDALDKKNAKHSFIFNDNDEQAQDFVEAEKERYCWDENRNEWYIPFTGFPEGRYNYDNYPIAKYRKR